MSSEPAVLATAKETVEPATAMSTEAATPVPDGELLDGAPLAVQLEGLMAHSNSFPRATLQNDTASSTEEAAAAAATADPAATAATADPAATAATADPAAPDPPSVRLRVLRDALGLTIEDVVGVDPEQLKMSLPFMKEYFALWHRLKKMAPSAGQLNEAEVAEFKTALKHLETIGNMSFRDFWEPWFATPNRIRILESRLAIALSDVEDKPAYYDKNDKTSGRFHQLVIAYALTGDHSSKYEYPPDEWLRRYVNANGLSVREEVTSTAWTPGMLGIRTSQMMTGEEFLREVEGQIAGGAFDALCPSVVVATLSRRLPEPDAGYTGVARQPQQNCKRFIAIKGVGAAEFSSGDCGKCVKNYPKVMVGTDKVRYLDIPNEERYESCIMDVLKSLWWGRGYQASMARVKPRLEPTAKMYERNPLIPVPAKPATAATATAAAATATAATTTAAAATATAATTAAATATAATTEAAATATAVAAAVAVAPHQPAK